MKQIVPQEIDENFIRLIGNEWMLIAAGDEKDFNMMTASWGMVGYLWNKPVVMVFVRPQRYTFGYVENRDEFTLSFFEERYREALNVCGTVSGREVNKVEKSGLTPYFTEIGNPAFEQARLVLECRKLYGQFLEEDAFLDKTIVGNQYSKKDFHKIYVGEIVNVWVRE